MMAMMKAMADLDPPAMPGELDHYGSMAWCEIYRASQLGLIEPEAADVDEPTRGDHFDPIIADLCGLTSTVH
jgi:hypothetical protein